MPLTRPRKEKHSQTGFWHYEDPQFCGPFCKYPKYGDYYSSSVWHCTQNQKVVTCPKCLDRMKKEGLWKNEDNE